MKVLVDIIKKRDRLIHNTRDNMAVSIREDLLISVYNEVLKSFGFPVRDTYNEPDGYDEQYWQKKAKMKWRLESEKFRIHN